MHLHGFTRATTDIDVVANRIIRLPWIEKIAFGGEIYQLDARQGTVELDWIVRKDHHRKLYELALADRMVIRRKYPTIRCEWLIMMKLAAGRPKDTIDVLWLLSNKCIKRKSIVERYRTLHGEHASAAIQLFAQVCRQADALSYEPT